jgi:hypothetical protein
MVALTVVLAMPASPAKRKTPCGCSNARVPVAKRRTRKAPITPSSVLPAAMASDVATVPAVVRLTRNAPRSTPGQIAGPKIRNAASAMPLGGHTAVALAFTNASCRPIFPAT